MLFKIIFLAQSIMLIIVLCKWITLEFALAGYIYFIDKNQYKQPSNEEMKACIDYAAKKLVKNWLRKKD